MCIVGVLIGNWWVLHTGASACMWAVHFQLLAAFVIPHPMLSTEAGMGKVTLVTTENPLGATKNAFRQVQWWQYCGCRQLAVCAWHDTLLNCFRGHRISQHRFPAGSFLNFSCSTGKVVVEERWCSGVRRSVPYAYGTTIVRHSSSSD